MTREEQLLRSIKAGKTLKGYKNDELAIRMHITPYQLRYKFLHPERMTVTDLLKFEEVLGIELIAPKL